MARDISVSIAVQGEKEFNQALKNAQSAVKVLASELKAGEAAFDENADAQAYYTNRTRLINAQIEQEKTILKSLEQAVREAANEFGEADAKTDKYRIALNRAHGEMAKLEKALRDTQKEAEELGRDSTRVGRQIENGIGDAAEDAADKLNDMVSQIERDMSDISRSVEFSALTDLGDALKGGAELVISGVSNLTEGTLEYRRQMAILETNAEKNGFDPTWLKQQALQIAAVTGDMDGAVEAASNLARVAPDVDAFTLAMNRMMGAALEWPDTLKIENLAESLQESLASGQITGAYSELMSRLGLDAETINKSIEEATKKGEEAVWNAGTAWMSESGFEETYEKFVKMNADLIAYNEAKFKVVEAEANLAEKLTPAATMGLEAFAGVIDSVATLIETLDLSTYLKGALDFLGATGEGKLDYISEAAGYLKDNHYVDWATSLWAPDEPKEILIPPQFVISEDTGTLKKLGEEAAEEVSSGFDDKIDGTAKEEGKRWIDGLVSGMQKSSNDNSDSLNAVGKSMGTQVAEGINESIDTVSTASANLFNVGEKIKENIKILYNKFNQPDEGKDAAEGAVKELTKSVQKAADDNSENMSAIGGNMGTQVAEGINESVDAVSAASVNLFNAIKEIFMQPITIPAPKIDGDSYDYNGATLKGGGSGTNGVNHIELVAQIEKRTVARAVTDDVSARLGESAAYYNTYG